MRTYLPLAAALAALLQSSAATVATTGISAGVNPTTGERPSRIEMSTFEKSGPAFDLYIQALAAFQADDQADVLSYYEIAGVYLFPPWLLKTAANRRKKESTVIPTGHTITSKVNSPRDTVPTAHPFSPSGIVHTLL